MAITSTRKRSKVLPAAEGGSSSQSGTNSDAVRQANVKTKRTRRKAIKLKKFQTSPSNVLKQTVVKVERCRTYERDALKRKAKLESHPWAGEVFPRNVVCLGCGQAIKTENSGDYYPYNFSTKHAPGCRMIQNYHELNPESAGPQVSNIPKGFLNEETVQAAWILAGMANPSLRILPVPKSRRR